MYVPRQAIALLAALLALGCEVKVEGTRQPCDFTFDCPVGEVCQGGACWPKDSKTDDHDEAPSEVDGGVVDADSVSLPDAAAEPDAPPALPSTIDLECEAGTLVEEGTGAIEAVPMSGASGGLAVRGPSSRPDWRWSASDPQLPPGRVELPMVLPAAGTYYLWVRLQGDDELRDALYAGFAATDMRRFFPPSHDVWVWVNGTPMDPRRLTFELPAGLVTLYIGPGEPIAACDRVVLTPDPDYVPPPAP